eukprot:751647_1
MATKSARREAIVGARYWKPQWDVKEQKISAPKHDDASKPLILMQKEREKQTLNGVRRGAYVASTARQSRSDRNRNRTSGYRSRVRRRYHPFANAEKVVIIQNAENIHLHL